MLDCNMSDIIVEWNIVVIQKAQTFDLVHKDHIRCLYQLKHKIVGCINAILQTSTQTDPKLLYSNTLLVKKAYTYYYTYVLL